MEPSFFKCLTLIMFLLTPVTMYRASSGLYLSLDPIMAIEERPVVALCTLGLRRYRFGPGHRWLKAGDWEHVTYEIFIPKFQNESEMTLYPCAGYHPNHLFLFMLNQNIKSSQLSHSLQKRNQSCRSQN